MEVSRPVTLTSDVMRRTIVAVIASAYGVITILILAYPVDNLLNSPMSVTVTAGIAVVAATSVVLRQKASGLYGKTYVALTIGLACWFAGEFIYTYESVVVGSSFSTISIA